MFCETHPVNKRAARPRPRSRRQKIVCNSLPQEVQQTTEKRSRKRGKAASQLAALPESEVAAGRKEAFVDDAVAQHSGDNAAKYLLHQVVLFQQTPHRSVRHLWVGF